MTKNIFLLILSLNHCATSYYYEFFETIYKVKSLEILVGNTPDFFRLVYNENKIFVCSPSLFSISECIEKSSRHKYFSNDFILEEFGIWAYEFQGIQVNYAIPKRKNLFLKLDAGFGDLYYQISYPTSMNVNANHHEYIKKGQFFQYLTGVTLFTLIPVPIAYDIAVFPFTIYYLLYKWGSSFNH